jgi:predicted nucleic acid-binding protein
MRGLEFLDTNVLVYSYDISDRRKQEVARGLVRRALAGGLVTSTQVLGEFAAALLHKVSPRVDAQTLTRALDALAPITVISTDTDMVRRAVEVHERYRVHYYDSLIIAAAERAGCECIWSEDLNAGQRYFGVSVQNPF